MKPEHVELIKKIFDVKVGDCIIKFTGKNLLIADFEKLIAAIEAPHLAEIENAKIHVQAADEENFHLKRKIAELERENERLMVDSDRYIFLISHLGLIPKKAESWNPAIDKPLLKFLQEFIDSEIPKTGNSFIKEQRKLLRTNK